MSYFFSFFFFYVQAACLNGDDGVFLKRVELACESGR